MKNQIIIEAWRNSRPIVSVNAEVRGRNGIQILVKIMQPNAHVWEELCDPHHDTDELLQVLSRGARGLRELLQITSNFVQFVRRKFHKA